MLIRKLHIKNFMSHKETSLELPDKGVVLVTGANGSGKSSIAESVATAVWGKTLRGSSPWVQDHAGSVSLEAEVGDTIYTFDRTATKSGRASASFEPSPATYSTNTKTQDAINDITGSFDAWRRCSVFSSQDAAHFTLATDSERKRLLETLLGLDKFDTALGLCRDEGKEISAKIRDLDREMIRKSTELERCRHSIKENKEKLGYEKQKSRYECAPPEEIEKAERRLEELGQKSTRIERRVREDSQTIYALRPEKKQLIKELTLFDNDKCPTCEQSLKGKSLQALKKEKQQKLRATEEELEALEEGIASLSGEVAEIEKEMRELGHFLSQEEFYRNSQEGALMTHLAECIRDLEKEEKALEVALGKMKIKMGSLEYDKALNDNTQTVLGTKGVRAHILTTALEALELTANKWLQKITTSGAHIEIRPYAQNKSGTRKEAISLDVVGIGDDKGYKALSGGQRRRVDVAILLGLAELARAASHTSRSTVFFDEVFDSLDEEGVSLVSSVIEEMGEERSVVVISHSPDFVAGLSPCMHVSIKKGEVSVI